jgi:hypothetical protein
MSTGMKALNNLQLDGWPKMFLFNKAEPDEIKGLALALKQANISNELFKSKIDEFLRYLEQKNQEINLKERQFLYNTEDVRSNPYDDDATKFKKLEQSFKVHIPEQRRI